MRNVPVLFCLLGVTLLFLACKSAKLLEALQQHEREIARAAGDDVAPQQKLAIVSNTFLAVLNEALAIGPVKKSGRHID